MDYLIILALLLSVGLTAAVYGYVKPTIVNLKAAVEHNKKTLRRIVDLMDKQAKCIKSLQAED
ncbi:hypothetical protein LCGC14_2541690 [marine sediment metagenome]|uniref:Uncharacterized protein n=1 Tax=marine sediment metagenome TaxID=412755 RepID=A0A0F9BDC6_9ZZZZ